MRRLLFFTLALIIISEGLQAQSGPQRVTGGFGINIMDVPWQVLLEINGSYACGGSIIAPNFILTARHCVSGVSASSIKVMAGVTCKSEINSSNTFNVSRIIVHPNLDVALLQLSSNITYNNSRRAINYWGALDNALYNVGNAVRVSGWGWLTPGGFNPASCLQAVDINIISNQDATNILSPLGLSALQTHEMATTGVGTVRQGACHGDSGGPLIIRRATNEPVLIGIVSWGRANCLGNNGNSPSIYVRVSNIVQWIITNATSISGPAEVCVYSGTYSLPAGLTGNWSASGNIRITSNPNGVNSVTVRPASFSGHSGTLTAVVNGVTVTKNIGVCYNEITGSDVVSSTGDYFSLLHGPPDGNWSVAGGYTITGNPASSRVMVTPVSSYNNQSILSVSVNGVVLKKTINAYPGVSGPERICGMETYTLLSNDPVVTWQAHPMQFLRVIRSDSYSITVEPKTPFPQPGLGGSIVAIMNASGNKAHKKTIYITCAKRSGTNSFNVESFVSAYPNPVSDILNIEIDTQTQSFAPAITSGTQLKIDKTYDLRLYDNQGTLLRNAKSKGGTVQFNVQNLTDGIYYLHVYDGVNSKPEMQQIVVEH